MTNTIIICMSLIIFVFSILGLWYNYKKEKVEDPNSRKRFTKKSLTVTAIIIALNVFNFFYSNFIQEEKFATKEEFEKLEAKYDDLKTSSPSLHRKKSRAKLINNLKPNLERIKKELLKNIRMVLEPIKTIIL